MKLAVRQMNRSGQALSNVSLLPELLGMPSELVKVAFRGTQVQLLAAPLLGSLTSRPSAPMPVTDPLHLELLSGSGEAPDWRRPVMVHAIIEARVDAALAVRRASRWASYAARVAVVPHARLNDKARLEAQLRGVWLVTADEQGNLGVDTAGERGQVEGSARGLPHRLLDELAWAALQAVGVSTEAAAKPSATTQVP